MITLNPYKTGLSFFLLLFIGYTQTAIGQHTKWVAPPEADKLLNPYKGNAEAIKQGQVVYQSMCMVCHGEKGKGNGAASVSLSPAPANFLSLAVRDESDGAVFWKLTNGNPPMAAYKTLLTDAQRWQLVNYIRQLEKQSK
jgi:mono/diheme cytochrome c family protein